jgi:phosphoglycolate phosphatase-like HAD superfamily hydrolase
MGRPLYIFDLDGTLANAEHRLHHIQGEQKDWRAFFAACGEDEPIQQTIATFRALRDGGAECWIWTGRSDEVEAQTVQWLRKHGVLDLIDRISGAPERLTMRKAGDHTPDHKLKFGWLADLEPPERRRLTAVFEDRDAVVRMWRDAGVTCFQVAPGAF